MVKLLTIAMRNVFRNKRRSTGVLILIVLSATVVVFLSSIFSYMQEDWRDIAITKELGDIQIMPKGAHREAYLESPLELTMAGTDQIETRLQSYDFIKAVTPRIDMTGMVSTGRESWGFIGRGIDPLTIEKALPKFKEYVVEGRLPREDEIDAGLIGKGLADRLGIGIDDMAFLVGTDKHGALNSIDIRVIGIINWEDYPFINNRIVFMHIENARILTAFESNELTSLVIRTDQYELAGEHKMKIAADLQNDSLEVLSWADLGNYLAQLLGFYGVIVYVVNFVFIVLIFVSISNTILMNVLERAREIGALIAIGYSKHQVRLIFMFESVFLGSLGALAGIAIGVIIVSIVNTTGGITSPINPDTDGVVTFRGLVDSTTMIQIFIMILILSIVASVFPANRAAKQRPVDVLRAN